METPVKRIDWELGELGGNGGNWEQGGPNTLRNHLPRDTKPFSYHHGAIFAATTPYLPPWRHICRHDAIFAATTPYLPPRRHICRHDAIFAPTITFLPHQPPVLRLLHKIRLKLCKVSISGCISGQTPRGRATRSAPRPPRNTTPPRRGGPGMAAPRPTSSTRSTRRGGRGHRGGKPQKHACVVCGKSFSRAASLTRHHKLHVGEQRFTCPTCRRSFACGSALREHRDGASCRHRPHKCRGCEKRFASAKSLQKHRKVGGAGPPAEQRVPLPRLRQDPDVQRGAGDAPADPHRERPYGCPECGKRFMATKSLNKHRKRHTENGAFACPDCGKTLTSKSTLIIHRRIHTGERPYTCPDCGKSFMATKSLSKHRKSHAEGAARPKTTENRPKSSGVAAHVGSRGVNPGEAFLEGPSLKKRQKDQALDKPHQCPHCGIRFTLHSTLLLHQKSHVGPRPYVCSECGKGFRDATTLRRHHRIHTGEKPYECSYCQKSFRASSTLIIHRRIHTGEKPYKCTKCPKCFMSSSSLMKHLRTHLRKELLLGPSQ
ncbi:zinc finger protein 883 [Columba livia]|uniref:zinc finger protein 883 n=1 Tax=Columba livia TaxID=8932 RepID=UPI0031BB212F